LPSGVQAKLETGFGLSNKSTPTSSNTTNTTTPTPTPTPTNTGAVPTKTLLSAEELCTIIKDGMGRDSKPKKGHKSDHTPPPKSHIFGDDKTTTTTTTAAAAAEDDGGGDSSRGALVEGHTNRQPRKPRNQTQYQPGTDNSNRQRDNKNRTDNNNNSNNNNINNNHNRAEYVGSNKKQQFQQQQTTPTPPQKTTVPTRPPDQLDILIIDALRPIPKINSHFSFVEVLKLMRCIRPKRTYLIGMNHSWDHEQGNKLLKQVLVDDGLHAELSYDGMLISTKLDADSVN